MKKLMLIALLGVSMNGLFGAAAEGKQSIYNNTDSTLEIQVLVKDAAGNAKPSLKYELTPRGTANASIMLNRKPDHIDINRK